jgi:hypothetical protein
MPKLLSLDIFKFRFRIVISYASLQSLLDLNSTTNDNGIDTPSPPGEKGRDGEIFRRNEVSKRRVEQRKTFLVQLE